MDKRYLRNRFKSERNALNRKYILSKSLLVSFKIYNFLKRYKTIASYIPCNNEINPNLVLDIKKLYFPKIKGDTMFACMPKNGFIKGYKNIREPFSVYEKIKTKNIDAIIVPGIAFDKSGNRIGYGKGFYDKFLKKFKGVKIGVTFDCCIVNRIESEKHDVTVDFIVSEKRNIVCKLRR